MFDCFSAARKLASRNDDPEHACRPFDRDRDGGVIAEGAGVLILENLEHALARGIRLYAEVVGYGTCVDPAVSEECSGLEMAMQYALANASWRPEQVEFISAHGPGDRQTDNTETALIKKVFGEHAYRIPVVSIKGSTGCPMGVGGMHQTIATALTIHHGKVPPTTNYENPDPDCDLDYVPGAPRRLPIARALINTHGFGRGNSSLLLQRIPDRMKVT